MNDSEEIGVSVCCLVYNHEPYLRQCLDGFISQRTNFKFEVLIHDDASTDRSAEIIREYEEKYPEIIKPIYQTENQYSQRVSITTKFLYPRARGKYVAFCEGDDYWTRSDKLQKQFDALENRPDCVVCVHKTKVWNEANKVEESAYPRRDVPNFLTGDDYVRYNLVDGYVFQTSSYFLRRKTITEYVAECPAFQRVACVGDQPMLLWLATRGAFFYLDDVFSCYRLLALGSWTTKRAGDNKRLVKINACAYRMYFEFDKYTNGKFTDRIKQTLRYFAKRVYVDSIVYDVERNEVVDCFAPLSPGKKFLLYGRAIRRKIAIRIKDWTDSLRRR